LQLFTLFYFSFVTEINATIQRTFSAKQTHVFFLFTATTALFIILPSDMNVKKTMSNFFTQNQQQLWLRRQSLVHAHFEWPTHRYCTFN